MINNFETLFELIKGEKYKSTNENINFSILLELIEKDKIKV